MTRRELISISFRSPLLLGARGRTQQTQIAAASDGPAQYPQGI